MDPTLPIEISVRIDSPQVVLYRLWYKEPGDSTFTIFATGDDQSGSNPSGHQHGVGPLRNGSTIRWFFMISGNPHSPYRITVQASQNGHTLGGDQISGTTDADGVVTESGGMTL